MTALNRCAKDLSLDEFSRRSGVQIILLRQFLDNSTRSIRVETWKKLYPVLQPFLEGREPIMEPPPRIGAAYRRHPDLVEMLSEQKVLLDEFNIFDDRERRKIIARFSSIAGNEAAKTTYESLNDQENTLMGCFLAMSPEQREAALAELTKAATEEARRRRMDLF